MKEIKSVSDIEKFAGKVVVVEIGWNAYKSGIVRIHEKPCGFQYGSYGYPVTCAVGKDGVHARSSITDRDLERGSVHIRLATQDEIANAIPSYGEIWWVVKGAKMTGKTILLNLIISLGTILTTMAAMLYFGRIAGNIGRWFLYFIGIVIIIISLSHFTFVLWEAK